jgi:hypothetical protein
MAPTTSLPLNPSIRRSNTLSLRPLIVSGGVAANSYALDLDAAGDVCFQWTDAANASHGALLHSSKYYKFDYPKSTATYGGGINDKGNIIGGYQTLTGGSNWFGFKSAYK